MFDNKKQKETEGRTTEGRTTEGRKTISLPTGFRSATSDAGTKELAHILAQHSAAMKNLEKSLKGASEADAEIIRADMAELNIQHTSTLEQLSEKFKSTPNLIYQIKAAAELHNAERAKQAEIRARIKQSASSAAHVLATALGAGEQQLTAPHSRSTPSIMPRVHHGAILLPVKAAQEKVAAEAEEKSKQLKEAEALYRAAGTRAITDKAMGDLQAAMEQAAMEHSERSSSDAFSTRSRDGGVARVPPNYPPPRRSVAKEGSSAVPPPADRPTPPPRPTASIMPPIPAPRNDLHATAAKDAKTVPVPAPRKHTPNA